MFNNQKGRPNRDGLLAALDWGVLSEPNDGDEKQRSRSENILSAAKALESLIVTCDESIRGKAHPLQ
jgi:hypothetical protein